MDPDRNIQVFVYRLQLCRPLANVRRTRGDGGGRARSVLPEPRNKIAFRSESRGTRRSKLISLIRFPCNSESKEVHFGPLNVSIMGGGGGGSKVTTVYRQYNW